MSNDKSKIVSFLLDNKFKLIVLTVYFLIVFVTMLHHEMWTDEARVWCKIREYGNLFGVLEFARDDGHPPLWFILLFPFVKLNFSPVIMQVCSLLLVFSGVCYFMFRSPFNNFVNLSVVFSAGMLYYFPVIARNYALIPLLMFVLMFAYKRRKESPYRYVVLLTLLSLTHSLMWGFCLICSMIFIFEKITEYVKERKISVLTPLTILLLNFFIMSFSYLKLLTQKNVCYEFSINHVLSFFCIFPDPESLKSYWSLDNLLFFPVFASVLIIFILLLIKDRKSFLISIFSFYYISFIFTFVTSAGIMYQKSFIYFLVLLFCVGITISKDKIGSCFNILLTVIFVILFFNPNNMPLSLVKDDIFKPYSYGKAVAEYIKENSSPDTEVLFVGWRFRSVSFEVWLPSSYKVNYLDLDREYDLYEKVNNEYLEKYIEDNSLNPKYVILYSTPTEGRLSGFYQKKFVSNRDDLVECVKYDDELPELFEIYYRDKNSSL